MPDYPPSKKISCREHPASEIIWLDKETNLRSGGSAFLYQPVCVEGKHSLSFNWMIDLLRGLDAIQLPESVVIKVSSKSLQNNTFPLGVYELTDSPLRELYLPTSTLDALQRLRYRFEQAKNIFDRYNLLQISDLRLNAIFFGPPGTGKSSAFAKVCNGIIDRAFNVSLRGLIGSHLGDTERNLQELITFIRTNLNNNIALLLDDADDFCSSRSSDNSAAGQTLNALKIGMLHLLDIASNVPVVLTTNRATALDAAIHRRIVEHVEFPLPDDATRLLILKGLISKIDNFQESISEDNYEILLTKTEGLNPAEIAQSIIDALCEINAKNESFAVALEKCVEIRKSMKSKVEGTRPTKL